MFFLLYLLINLTLIPHTFASTIEPIPHAVTVAQFSCSQCNRTFNSQKNRNIHVGLTHRKQTFQSIKPSSAKRPKVFEKPTEIKTAKEHSVRRQARIKKSAEQKDLAKTPDELSDASSDDLETSTNDESSEGNDSSDEEYVPCSTSPLKSKRKRVAKNQPSVELSSFVLPDFITYCADSLYMTNNELDFNRHLLAVQIQNNLINAREPEFIDTSLKIGRLAMDTTG